MQLRFERFSLPNGLRVLVHQDATTPMVAVNVLYDVGARDESPEKTGFAHLFEHLMFGGSVHIPVYDEPLQMAGGENNAYTTNDLTNYYIQVPLQNLETAFWLESDRMKGLAFSQKSLDVQRKVVSEEFKEHYLNKPYGDAAHHLRELAYTKHPYQWMTIGKQLRHIQEAKLEDVTAFFWRHYRPINAILSVAGNVHVDQVKALAEKWFGDIEAGDPWVRDLPQEPRQMAARTKTVYADVPLDAVYMAWHMCERLAPQYYAADLITEIMGTGFSSRLYQRLVKEERMFSSINCYHTGALDPGLIIVEGKIMKDKRIEQAQQAILREMNALADAGVSESELQKAKNRVESLIEFEDMSLLSRANNLAFYELLGDAARINTEFAKYDSISAADLQRAAQEIFRAENCNTLFYRRSYVPWDDPLNESDNMSDHQDEA